MEPAFGTTRVGGTRRHTRLGGTRSAQLACAPRVRHNSLVQHAFGTVLWVVCGASALAAVIALFVGRKVWDEYGKSRLVLDSDAGHEEAAGSPAAGRERDAEIRELIEARNALRRRRGEPALDPELELARLTAPQIDASLREEIRDLVIARNHRRVRAGKEPLDIEAEIRREIESLSEL